MTNSTPREITLSAGTFDRLHTFRVEGVRGRCSLHSGYEKEGDGILWIMQHAGCIAAHYGADEIADRSRSVLGLKEAEAASMLDHLIRGGDFTRYGLHNAVTRTAQDLESYDRASELERLGGRIIELPAKDWRTLAVTAKAA